MSIAIVEVLTLTTALLSVPKRARFQAGPPLGSGLFTYPPSDTDSDKQTPPLERQTLRLNGRMRGLVVENYVEQRTVDLQSAVVMDET